MSTETSPAEDVACNLCGLSCVLRGSAADLSEHGGLIAARVSGGYDSTPGNGCGALDDTTAYTFSMCEFCLDWLFAQFKIPVATTMYMDGDVPDEPWRPAAERVATDGWRRMKDAFTVEAARRDAARCAAADAEVVRLREQRDEAKRLVCLYWKASDALELESDTAEARVAQLEAALHQLWNHHHLSDEAVMVVRAALKETA